jgi:hypothetical protein
MKKSRRPRMRAPLAAALLAVALGAAYAQGSIAFRTVSVHRQRPGYWKATASCPRFLTELPIGKAANRTLKPAADKGMRQFVQQSQETFTKFGRPRAPYEHLSKPTVSLARPTVVSVYFTTFEYTGGAHGNTWYSTYNFGFRDGKPVSITLRDLFRPGENAVAVTTELMMAKLRANPRATFVKDGTVKSIGPELALQFVVSPAGLTFLLPPYAVAPYVEGSIFVKIPFSEFGDRLNPDGPLKGLR